MLCESEVKAEEQEATGRPKKVHKFKIMYLCSDNRQITNFCVIC